MEYAKDSKERIPYEHYIELFQGADPIEMSERTGIPFDLSTNKFTIRFMGSTYEVSHPSFEITHKEDSLSFHPLESLHYAKVFISRYFVEGSFAQATGKYLTYREMPWGEVYFKQFQGRCIMRMAYGFGNKLQEFSESLELLGAKRLTLGDISYELEFLEGLYLQLILWEGDEEFPTSAQILFSDNFVVCTSAEDRAVVGDVLISTLKAFSK